jgi:branched-chain amino acid transport system ATP-binding protein
MTVLENLKLGAYFVKGQKDRASRLERVFDIFPLLQKRVGQTAGTLSGGEQSMLSIGRSIMGRPRVLLLDEPSLGLAPKLVQEFFATIGRIHREDKISMLLIEQNAAKALSVADRGYILQKGRIIAEGTAQELVGSDIVRKAYFCQTEE